MPQTYYPITLYDKNGNPVTFPMIRGEKGDKGERGEQGTGVSVKATAAECDSVGDGYIDADGNLQILTELPSTFTNGGQIKGPKGDKGDTGPQGPQGPQGDKGEKGDKGNTGTQGVQGIQGIQGDKGEKGDPGANGVSCTHEWNGTTLTVTSASGTTSADLKGEKGDTGAAGANGAKGDKGDKGDPGEKGDKGDPGENGATGATGAKGEKGDKGDQGDPGKGMEYLHTVQDYGAVGDGTTDDTTAFQNALAANRVVVVPGGTYKLSGTLTIRENCCLELAQDAVLDFTQTNVNCITLLRLANLKGNHATINVPYTFSANVINCDTRDDEAALDFDRTLTGTAYDTAIKNANSVAVPPFTKWSPQWKMSRYVTDINICKPKADGEHNAPDENCYGTAVYLGCHSSDDNILKFMWGVSVSGLRIAGGFTHGIHVYNTPSEKNTWWNHDMRIEGVIDACEIGVLVENCHCSRFAVTIQPRKAANGAVYAKHGFKLVNSNNIDLTSSRVWDWNESGTCWTNGGEYQHIAMYGDCGGLILDDFLYNKKSIDIRSLIYTDTASNLESMTILQEPITRWFKPIDGEPHFNDGYSDQKLVLQREFDEHFNTDFVKSFTDVLASAEDTDGTILNGVGYKIGARLGENGTVTESAYYGYTGFIPCKKGSTIYAKDLNFDVGEDYAKVIFYDASKNYIIHINRTNIATGNNYYAAYKSNEGGFSLTVNNISNNNNIAYARFTFYKTAFGENPMMAIDEEIKYEVEGFLADGVKVKAENVVGLPASESWTFTLEDGSIVTKKVCIE